VIPGDPDELRRRLRDQGAALVTVATGSMAPTLNAGESVTVRRASAQAGDVALIVGPAGLTLHRLIARLPGPARRWVHAGDAAGAGAGLCRAEEIVAIAELPRRLPGVARRARLLALALIAAIGAVRSRWLARAGVALLASLPALSASCSGCKPKAPRAVAPPRIVEVRLVDRTGPGSPLDAGALQRRAAQVLGEATGLAVTDGGMPEGGAFRLRVEVRAEAGPGEGGRPMIRALVDVKLSPQGGAGLLGYEQTAIAERDRESAGVPDGGSPMQALAERAIGDVLRGVGARVKLASSDARALTAALEGADDDLKLEALRVAGERHLTALVPAIIPLLKSEDRDVRDRAVGTLAALGDARAVKPLTEVARFRDLTDLPMVLDALAAIGGDEARAYLEFVASGHENPEMRELARKALTYLEARARRDLGSSP